jgi:hypothetical protein
MSCHAPCPGDQQAGCQDRPESGRIPEHGCGASSQAQAHYIGCVPHNRLCLRHRDSTGRISALSEHARVISSSQAGLAQYFPGHFPS